MARCKGGFKVPVPRDAPPDNDPSPCTDSFYKAIIKMSSPCATSRVLGSRFQRRDTCCNRDLFPSLVFTAAQNRRGGGGVGGREGGEGGETLTKQTKKWGCASVASTGLWRETRGCSVLVKVQM